MISPWVSRSAGPTVSYQRPLIAVVAEATLVNADMGLPSRQLLGIELDFVGQECGSLMGQGHDSTKTLGVVLFGRGRPGTQSD